MAKAKLSYRKLIDLKCKDCIYDPQCGGGTWREQIAQCSSVSCPLWPIRASPSSGPYSNPYRDPDTVPKAWLRLPVGQAISPAPIESKRKLNKLKEHVSE
jgi:hypothetical protein